MAAVRESKTTVGTEAEAGTVGSVTDGTTEVVAAVVVDGSTGGMVEELGTEVKEAMDRRQSDTRLLEVELGWRL